MKGTHMSAQDKTLHIDIPVKLTEVKVVFSVASLSFEGDLPASPFHLHFIVNDISNWKAKSQVVVVFHTNAGHVALHDQAYNPDRNIATGNPYKKLVTDLMGARRASRTLWRHSKGSWLGKCRSHSRNKDQHRCHGENDAACSRGICEDL
jgi:hypothetical protein